MVSPKFVPKNAVILSVVPKIIVILSERSESKNLRLLFGKTPIGSSKKCQGTTSVGPKMPENKRGLQPLREN